MDPHENRPEKTMYHICESDQTMCMLGTGWEGLDSAEAERRLSQYGPNLLAQKKNKTLLSMFLAQFKEVMVLVLLVAVVISALMHEYADAGIILVVIVLNAIMGVVQESKAEKALEALKQMSSPCAAVKRDGSVEQIPARDLVPGDMVVFEAGDLIPADMRLVEAASLKIDESALTGESVPVEKTTSAIQDPDLLVGDRTNMAYSSSQVAYGRGMGVVTATGMNTEVGNIAKYLAEDQQDLTPLQKKLAEMGKYLTIGILVIAVIIFAVGAMQGRGYVEMLLVAISLSVAAIPEGLPAVVTIVLAVGVVRMSRRNAIISNLSAVETLGGTEVICSDKTGTLTQNKMTVREIFIDGRLVRVSDTSTDEGGQDIFMQIMVLCNDARSGGERDGKATYSGDPTEIALVNFGEQMGYSKTRLEETRPRVGEVPFDSERKLMSTIHPWSDSHRLLTKGAPDVLLSRCSAVLLNGEIYTMDKAAIGAITAANHAMAERALRVLAVAYRDLIPQEACCWDESLEQNLIFAGLVGMIDPARPEARQAVRLCRQAGIRPVMITGDHWDTAFAIAQDLEIATDHSQVLSGQQLDGMSDAELCRNVTEYAVYARVSPEHKVRIVKAWKENNRVVAMTGDGVNDAPALKAADIGVGMGLGGTDVARGVSNMVLADDNFATIVAAVEEGRKIFNNIRKAIQFLLSSNLGEVITLFLGTMLNWVVLMPIHILWVNLVTDALPALALGMEEAEKDIMSQPPRDSSKGFFADGMWASIIHQGMLKGVITLAVYYVGTTWYSHDIGMTMAFATLGLIQLADAFNVRSLRASLFQTGFFTNPYLTAAVAISAFLQVMVIAIPALNPLFRVTSLNLHQWLMVAGASLSIIPIMELVKIMKRLK